jgi:plastocyanin
MRRTLVFLVVATTAGCGGGTKDTSPVSPQTPNPVATNAVSINDNSFSPEAAEVAPNTPVTWTWQGAAQHNVTFEDGKEASGTKVTGTHSRTFGTNGTYRYRCTIHSSSFTSGMVGSVVVQ